MIKLEDWITIEETRKRQCLQSYGKDYGLGDQVVPRELMERGLSDERNHSQDRAHEACKCKAGSGAPYGWERAPVCRAAWQPEVGMLSFIERITSERRSY